MRLFEEDRIGPYLAAYVTKASSPPEGHGRGQAPSLQPPTREELQSYLRERLPNYMVPTVFIYLEAMPLTLNGKVDCKALPVPERATQSSRDYVAPQSELEQRLAKIWQEVLGMEEQVGIYDNFFDLGGHSLLLIRVRNKLAAYLGNKASMVDLFQYPTIHALSTYLSGQQEQQPLLQPVIEQVQKRREALRKFRQTRGNEQ